MELFTKNKSTNYPNTEPVGAFLFKDEEVDKKVQVLSGGEKNRLALTKMIVQPANLLILDEPTNHLDMNSQEILQQAMAQYNKTIITVSHNRHFVNGFINKVLEIKDGHASIYEGNIDDYLYKLKSLQEKETASRMEEDRKALTDQPAKQKGRAARQDQAGEEQKP